MFSGSAVVMLTCCCRAQLLLSGMSGALKCDTVRHAWLQICCFHASSAAARRVAAKTQLQQNELVCDDLNFGMRCKYSSAVLTKRPTA